MKLLRTIALLACFGMSAGLLVGCKEKAPAEKAGGAIENAAEDVKDKAEDAAEDVKDAAEDAAEDVGDAIDEATE